jgi:hypothetical protein
MRYLEANEAEETVSRHNYQHALPVPGPQEDEVKMDWARRISGLIELEPGNKRSLVVVEFLI